MAGVVGAPTASGVSFKGVSGHCSGRLQRVAPGSGESGGREPLTTGAGGRDLPGRFSLSTWSPLASLSHPDSNTHGFPLQGERLLSC